MFTTEYQMDNADALAVQHHGAEPDQPRRAGARALVTSRCARTPPSPPTRLVAFNLNGVDLTKGGTYVSGERLGVPYVGYCPAGKAFTGFLPNVFTNSVVANTVKAHGPDDGLAFLPTNVDLPNA